MANPYQQGGQVRPIPLHQMDFTRLKVKALLIGPQSCGKTIFTVGSQVMRTLHIDVDGMGIMSAKCWPGNPLMGIPPVNPYLVDTVPAPDWRTLVGALDYAEKNANNYDLLVVDTVTEFQRRLQNELLGTGLGSTMERTDWGAVLNQMEGVTQSVIDLPMHVIFTAHETDRKDQADGLTKWAPSFTGKFKDLYGKHFSEIWRYTTANKYWVDEQGIKQVWVDRLLQCQMDETMSAKDRSNALDKWEYPFIDHIFGKIMHRVHSVAGSQGQPQQYQAAAQPLAQGATQQ